MFGGSRRSGPDAASDSSLRRVLTDAGVGGIGAFLAIAVVYLIVLGGFWLQVYGLLTDGASVAGAVAEVALVGSASGPWGLLAALILGLWLGIFLSVFFAVFVFVSFHGAEIEFVVTATESIGPLVDLLPVSATVFESGTIPITTETLAIPFAGLGLALPPLVLFGAGAVVGVGSTSRADLLRRPIALVLGYGVATAAAVLGVTWLFNLVVAELFVAVVSVLPGVQVTKLTVVLPDFPRAVLRMCVGYPLVFGGAGALVAYLVGRVRRGEQGEEGEDEGEEALA